MSSLVGGTVILAFYVTITNFSALYLLKLQHFSPLQCTSIILRAHRIYFVFSVLL